ncbi:hypothetical protein N0V93_000190 [Gnomoniopsis smithogilvyi]|uniref:Spray n=1 Tax=Gnomoniopsis smithogilvyi TaxID=1191159 RepID=A0A9W9D156_9PEZI|nr:hypothetical protein N0V93_000190 [Gnomoniopsis smithogilvyi]
MDLGNDNRGKFSSRIESFRDISSLDYGYYDDEAISAPTSPISRGRESMVSPPTQFTGGSPKLEHSASGQWQRPFSSDIGDAYQTGSGAGVNTSAIRLGSSTTTRKAYSGRYNSLISNASFGANAEVDGQESADIALLPAANPIDGNAESNIASSPGPREEEDKAWRQEQELAGHLTGGLGAGFKAPAIRIREADLPSPTSPVLQRMPSRALSFSRRKMPLNRTKTRKMLGQDQANRTGQAVQVIVEEPEADDVAEPTTPLQHHNSNMDLSFVAGDAMPVESEELRVLSKSSTTYTAQKLIRTETFYPNPDWKPFSMRWPYLSMLIILSFTLAGCSEILYQCSTEEGHLIQFTRPTEIEGIEYFSIKFLPTLLAVIFGVLWEISDFEVKRLEPYFQLSRDNGATGAETLNVDYITSYRFLVPFDALRRGQYAVAISSIASLLAVSAVPTLCAASIVLSPSRDQRMADPDGVKWISINPIFSRLNGAALVIIALLGCVLMYQLSMRRSGLLGDVKGIAGLAAMANVSHIIMDFKDMDVATHEDIHRTLKKRRYYLQNSALAPVYDSDYTAIQEDTFRITGQDDINTNQTAKYHLSVNPQPFMFRKEGTIPFICGILLFTILLPVLLFQAPNLTEKAPWIITALAVCIKLAWGALDTTTRLMEPFYLLYKRHAPPRTLTLDYTALPFAWVSFQAMLNGHYLVSAVGLGTVMTEVLTVLVSSLATVEGKAFGPSRDPDDINAGEETVHSFWISLVSATIILLYMAGVAGVVYVRRRTPFVPRQPNTIASVLAFIHQSKMLYDFVGTEKYSNSMMVNFLTETGKSYGLGWFEGRDGRVHCGVDEEELMHGYAHGVDYSRSNNPWVENHTEWL